jgi:cytochrome c biogenesis protein CcmG, thiol:disulfide interchange protein DsbE
MNKRLMFTLPLMVFLILAGYFAVGLTKDPKKLPNMLKGKPVPDFALKPIKGRDDKGFASTDLKGETSLVNIFGSWCVACQIEHPFLMKLKAEGAVPIHGIDWREKDPDAGPDWLKKHGDPYALVGDDPRSKAAIAFGVTGAPETFVVDGDGVVRFKYVGPLNADIWRDVIEPVLRQIKPPGAS